MTTDDAPKNPWWLHWLTFLIVLGVLYGTLFAIDELFDDVDAFRVVTFGALAGLYARVFPLDRAVGS
jgi:hypothetical protein